MIPNLRGVPVEKDSRLPLSKIDAICLPKDDDIKREFWIDTSDKVWGYFDKIGLERKVYLSEKAFDKLMNADLATNIND